MDQLIDRLKKVFNLVDKMNSSKKQVDIDFYKDFIPSLLKNNESVDNLSQVYQEYIDAYAAKQQLVKKLFDEIKKIKSLKV